MNSELSYQWICNEAPLQWLQIFARIWNLLLKTIPDRMKQKMQPYCTLKNKDFNPIFYVNVLKVVDIKLDRKVFLLNTVIRPAFKSHDRVYSQNSVERRSRVYVDVTGCTSQAPCRSRYCHEVTYHFPLNFANIS